MNVVAPSSDLQKSIKTKNKGRETIMDENLKTEGNEKLSKMLNSEEQLGRISSNNHRKDGKSSNIEIVDMDRTEDSIVAQSHR